MTPISQFRHLISAIHVHLPVPTPLSLPPTPPSGSCGYFFYFSVKFIYIGMHKSSLFDLDEWLHSSKTLTGWAKDHGQQRWWGGEGDTSPATGRIDRATQGVSHPKSESHQVTVAQPQPPKEAGGKHDLGLSWLGQGLRQETGS